MRKFLNLLCFIILMPESIAQGPYVGTTMSFADYLENACGIVFKEEGMPADPFTSIKLHGANIVRLEIQLPPFSSSYTNGVIIDYASAVKIKNSMQRAKDAGLKTLLTFTYRSFALEDSQRLNDYVAPLPWQSIASDLDKIADSVYAHTYSILNDYCRSGLVPEIVSVGNESVWRRLEPNIYEDQLPVYDPWRSVVLHNAGSRAVRDIAEKYSVDIKVCFHMMGPSRTKWWLETHAPYGLNFDMIGISLYHGWNDNDYAGYDSLGSFVAAIIKSYGIEFIVMETAQLFASGGNDNHVDILGTENIPEGYPNPPIAETQKQYLIDITNEVIGHGGSGTLVWGGDWVANDCIEYADQWGAGSSWENKSFWDFNYNLHDGVNWMMAFSGKVPVTFKVDMDGVDVSRGVFITGSFRNMKGKTWMLNPMKLEGNSIYAYTTYLYPDSTGVYYFLNDTLQSAREAVPLDCSADSGSDRAYQIPLNSIGEVYAFPWGSCEPVPQYSLTTGVIGKGSTSPVKGLYSRGVQVILTAASSLGWKFEGWTGDTVSSLNPIVINMDSAISITAKFVPVAKVAVTFKVDMTDIDVSNGVYITGEFPNLTGDVWMLNKMKFEGNHIYSYTTSISLGSSGAYYFLNDDKWGVRENVPVECAVYYGSDRGYSIPLNSSGEVFAFKWSSCSEIQPVSSDDAILKDESDITIFPVPVKNETFTVRYNKPLGEIHMSLVDIHGMLIISFEEFISTACEKEYVIPGDISGSYFLLIESAGGIQHYKLIVQQ